jgi:ribosomal protein S18 acetylase RimI-like enzyme
LYLKNTLIRIKYRTSYAMDISITKANTDNYPFLKQLETTCFDDHQRSSNKTIKTSINSAFQGTYIACVKENGKWVEAASLIVHLHKKTLRLYSIAVLPQFRNRNIGQQLMQYCIQLAIDGKFEKISLEAMTSNTKLINWYEGYGFKTVAVLKDYYSAGFDANRMVLKI